jgi:hypothetical protein
LFLKDYGLQRPKTIQEIVNRVYDIGIVKKNDIGIVKKKL